MRLFHFPKTIRLENGDVYKGDVKDGRPSGKGVMRYTNGDVYEGSFVDGVRSGQGVMIYSDGTVYSGAWKDDPQPLAFIELEATAFGGVQHGVSLWWIWPNTQR